MYEYLTIKDCKRQIQECTNNSTKFQDFKLCYIDKVDTEIWDYTPESKDFMKNNKEYLAYEKQIKEKFEKDLKEFGHAHYEPNPLQYIIEGRWYPNPELKKGTYRAYFTNIPLEKQWGDDWNDAPYEHNAECPYDDYYEGDERIEHNIKVVYFTPNSQCTLPEDYCFGGNSPFSVEMINKGTVAWLYNGKKAIQAGCNLLTFIKEIENF